MIVVWHEERRRFEAISSYLERSLAKENRWRWDNTARRWWAPSEDIARRLARFATGPAALRLMDLDSEERLALAASQAQDSDIQIPAPPGLDYLPYQRACIAYALSRPSTLIGDEMGLGKTIQAIGVVNALVQFGTVTPRDPSGTSPNGQTAWPHEAKASDSRDRRGLGKPVLPGARSGEGAIREREPPHPYCEQIIAAGSGRLERVLIVCPASLRLNWRAEWRRWHTGRLRPTLLDVWPGGLFDETAGKALIVSYDSVRKWHPQIAAVAWDILIMDEIHLVKDETTRRAKTIFGGKYRGETYEPLQAKRILGLSGTPIVNKPAELWPLVKALAPDGLGKSRVDFMTRYGAGQGLDELHVKLRSQIMVRRLKENVLKQLPKKRRQIVLLEVAGSEGVLRAESEVVSLQRAMLEKTRAEIDGLPHAEQVMRLRQCRAIALSEIARVRHETAIAKLPAAVEHIHDVLSNVDKTVVFAHHLDVLDGLKGAFARIATGLDGRTSEADRQSAVDRFQRDRTCRLFLGGLRAAGLGITLTAASVVVFVELDWTPAAMMQAEDRLHRIGQVNPVLVQHLVIDGSIDQKMAAILVDKQAMMDATLDGGKPDVASRDILAEVMRA